MTPTWEGVISPSVASSITVVGIKDDLLEGWCSYGLKGGSDGVTMLELLRVVHL